MKHKHYDVIVAWAEGKAIEYRSRGMGNATFGEWQPTKSPTFAVCDWLEWRIKPTEYWAPVFRSSDSVSPFLGRVYCTKEEAEEAGDVAIKMYRSWRYQGVTKVEV